MTMRSLDALPAQTGPDREELERRIWTLEETNRALRESFRELTALQDLARALSEAHDLERVLEILTQLMARIVDYTQCIPFLIHPETRRWHPGRTADREQPLPRAVEDHLREGLFDWVAENRRPTVVSVEEGEEPQSFLLVPLMVGGEPLGAVHLSARLDASAVSLHHVDMLTLLAHQAAAAIRNIQLFEQTRQLKDYFQDCLESLANAVVVLNRESRVTIVNRSAAELLGLDRNGITGRSYRDVFPDRVLDTLDRLVTDALLSKRVAEREIELPRDPADALPVAIASSRLTDSGGNLLGVILLFRDLTLTREIDHLRRLDQLKNEFVSNVSHELRTPLTSIKAYAESLLDTVEDTDIATRREFLGTITEECDRLSRLISDLLDLARIERGRYELQKEPTDLIPLIRRTVAFFAGTSKIHQFRVETPGDLPLVLVDPDGINQVLTNLIGNAVKYSPQGGEIAVRVHREPERFVIEVADPGIGIFEPDLERIFEKFYRTDNAISAAIGGTGLGLHISKYIVEAHGGHIEVESEHSVGSRFRFWLPTQVACEGGPSGNRE